MSSTRSEDLDPETSDRSLTSDVLLRQEPDEEEDEEEEEEDNGKEDDHDDDEEDDGYSEMSQARRRPRSALSIPVPTQRNPLDFLLAQQEVRCYGNTIGALAQLFRQIVLADDYVPVGLGRWLSVASCGLHLPEPWLVESYTTVIIPFDDGVIFVCLLNRAEFSIRLSEVAQTLDAISGSQLLTGGGGLGERWSLGAV